MITWGINALNHDASIAIFNEADLLWHNRASTFTNIPGDSELNTTMVQAALQLGYPSQIYWYEDPWLKKSRQLYAGQYNDTFTLKDIPANYLAQFKLSTPVTYGNHHMSHAAAGYYTSPFQDATIVVADAIGEWESMSIWKGKGDNITKLWSKSYPDSLGLFYSAFTHLLGFTPVKEEYKLQQLAERGDPHRFKHIVKQYLDIHNNFNMPYNLHRGVYNWPYPIKNEQDKTDIAAAVQQLFCEAIHTLMLKAKILNNSKNLVYMGGCAMNSAANKTIDAEWDKIWSLPIPGDASSAIGAVLAKRKMHISYTSSFETKHLTIKT